MEKYKYKFSVIIPIYNVEDYLEETIESVINQSIGFKDNIQIVLINDGSPDNSEKICLKYKDLYPDNIIYFKQKNAGVSVARNKGIELAEGEFVNFLDSDDLWSLDAFEEMYKQYTKHPDVHLYSCKMNFFDGRKGNHPLNYKYSKNKVVNILEEYEYPQLSSSSIFIKRSCIKDYRYDKTVKYSEDNKFINEIIFDELKIMMLKKPIYYYRKRFNGTSALQGQTMNLAWYLTTPDQVYNYLIDLSKKKFGRVIEYIQYLICYELSWRVPFNTKYDMAEKDRKKYSELLIGIINNMDDEVILSHRHLDLAYRVFLLKLKYKKDFTKELQYDDDSISLKDMVIKKKSLGFVLIDQIYIKNGKFEVFGKLDRRFVSEKDFHVKNGNKDINVEYYELTNDYNIETFNKENLHDYIGVSFVLDSDLNWDIGFYDKDNYLVPRFKRNGIFSEYLIHSYHHYNNRTMYFKLNKIYNRKRNIFRSFWYELCNDLQLLKNKRFKALVARLYIKFNSIFKSKELWLISDRVNKADDNGEHFFRYMVKNHPEINVYFVLTKNSVDYKRISKIGKIIDPNSLKYKLMIGISDYVISSQAENYVFNPLGNGSKFVADQYHYKYVFLQHGITKDDLSPWINVNTKKMDMFVTAAIPEYESLLTYKYYFGPDIVKLTGFPRFDTLIEKQKKYKVNNTIMLSLTWRNSLASLIDKETGKRAYNPDFKNSDYFKFLNNLMNDKRVHEALKKYNYKIRFIPHPNVLVQMKDFSLNDYIEVCEDDVNYQKEFCENKILITDYSSVFFDFGYLKKPVIYYQADVKEFYSGQLYNKGYFDNEKMGFGPVFYEYDKFVDGLIKIIKNDGKLEKKYEDRINKFFKFNDTNNCQRVYDNIIRLEDSK
ncbi:MAG: CDP-glycerol glycerophosphotransferase family protein [Bacilli bacterium]|nr:CDP-glycerol glycerophosphotransferase family protein [Bacilli bacterium]